MQTRNPTTQEDYFTANTDELSLARLMSFIQEFPGMVSPELLDHISILAHSARIGKYALNNWLEPNGKGCGHKTMYASIFRHVSEAYCQVKKDKDSGLDPRLHAAIRLMMDYTRDQKGLEHEEDKYAVYR